MAKMRSGGVGRGGGGVGMRTGVGAGVGAGVAGAGVADEKTPATTRVAAGACVGEAGGVARGVAVSSPGCDHETMFTAGTARYEGGGGGEALATVMPRNTIPALAAVPAASGRNPAGQSAGFLARFSDCQARPKKPLRTGDSTSR